MTSHRHGIDVLGAGVMFKPPPTVTRKPPPKVEKKSTVLNLLKRTAPKKPVDSKDAIAYALAAAGKAKQAGDSLVTAANAALLTGQAAGAAGAAVVAAAERALEIGENALSAADAAERTAAAAPTSMTGLPSPEIVKAADVATKAATAGLATLQAAVKAMVTPGLTPTPKPTIIMPSPDVMRMVRARTAPATPTPTPGPVANSGGGGGGGGGGEGEDEGESGGGGDEGEREDPSEWELPIDNEYAEAAINATEADMDHPESFWEGMTDEEFADLEAADAYVEPFAYDDMVGAGIADFLGPYAGIVNAFTGGGKSDAPKGPTPAEQVQAALAAERARKEADAKERNRNILITVGAVGGAGLLGAVAWKVLGGRR